MTEPAPGTRYDAFISYSHAADGAFAPALQRALARFGKPWRRRRAMEVFRDQTGLAVDPDLWGAIVAALDASEWFVLLASPRAAASAWVGKEIEHCVQTKGAQRLLIVLTDGTLTWDAAAGDFTADSDAAHPALRGLLEDAPVIVDLSWTRGEVDLSTDNPRFRADVARIVAAIRGEQVEDAVARDTRERRRTRSVVRAAVGALAAGALLAVGGATVAAVNMRTAQQEQEVAEAEARVALAREVAAVASAQDDPRTALALAAEAYAIAPLPETAGGLLTAVAAPETGIAMPSPFAGVDPASIVSSSDTGRLLLAEGGTLQVVDPADDRRWALETSAAAITPDGERVIIEGGAVLTLGEGGTTTETATIPAPQGRLSFSGDGMVAVFARTDGTVVAADVETGDAVEGRFGDGSYCADCMQIGVSDTGDRIAVRATTGFDDGPGSARVVVLARTADELALVAEREAAGAGMVRFADDGALWARDGGSILVLDPASLEPVASAMTIVRAGPLDFADDDLALAPGDECTPPGVVSAPTLATVADLPGGVEYTEAGCVPSAEGPQWLVDAAWIRLGAQVWPTDGDALLRIACETLGGPMTAEEFAQVSTATHEPAACEGESR